VKLTKRISGKDLKEIDNKNRTTDVLAELSENNTMDLYQSF